MAESQAQKTADSLATLPTAKEIMEQIALKEAEKASAAARELSAADAEKKALIEKFSKPSGVSDEERLARRGSYHQTRRKQRFDRGRGRSFSQRTMYRSRTSHQSARTGLGKNPYRLPEGALRLLGK